MATKRRRVPPDPEIGNRIRRVLAYLERDQSWLARELAVTPAAVSQWVTGVVTPSDESAQLIGDATGEDWEWIMGRKLTGSKGLGAILGRIYDRLGDDRARYLADDADAQREVLEVLDKLRSRSTPRPVPPVTPLTRRGSKKV
jgi:transcriptional regulator with XRE-family HTH domain